MSVFWMIVVIATACWLFLLTLLVFLMVISQDVHRRALLQTRSELRGVAELCDKNFASLAMHVRGLASVLATHLGIEVQEMNNPTKLGPPSGSMPN